VTASAVGKPDAPGRQPVQLLDSDVPSQRPHQGVDPDRVPALRRVLAALSDEPMTREPSRPASISSSVAGDRLTF
jgi:hypothetical protein